MFPLRIGITDDTTPDDMDRYFTNIWKHKKKVSLIFDTTQCEGISFRKIMKLRPILNKHRANSRKFIKETTILVNNGITCNLLKLALCFVRTENPVYVNQTKQ